MINNKISINPIMNVEELSPCDYVENVSSLQSGIQTVILLSHFAGLNKTFLFNTSNMFF